jgi:hypothetical protein
MTYALEVSNPPFTLSGPHFLRSWLPSPSASSITFVSPWTQRRDAPAPVVERASWLHENFARLQSISRLLSGWDGGQAREIDKSLIDGVARFISSEIVSRLKEPPQIIPTIQGGLLIEWHTMAVDLLIESSPAEEPTFFYRDVDRNTEVEGSIADHMQALQAAFTKLS